MDVFMALGMNHNHIDMDTGRWVRPAQRSTVKAASPAIATLTLSLILVIVMFIEIRMNQSQLAAMIEALGLRATDWSWIDLSGYSPILTHSLLHGSSTHFFWNLVALILVGTVVEWRLGWRVVAGLFLIGAIVAGASHLLIFPAETRPLIGASGIVSTMFGVAFVVAGDVGMRVRIPRTARWLRFNARRPLLVWLAFQIYYLALAVTTAPEPMDVAYWSHLAGFTVGVAVSLLYRHWVLDARTPAPEAAFTSAGD